MNEEENTNNELINNGGVRCCIHYCNCGSVTM